MNDDLGFSRRSVVAAALAFGGLLAFVLFVAALGPATATPTGLRLHTPTVDPRHIAEQAYKITVAREVENIAFEVNVISTGVQLADYSDPDWQEMMTDSAVSLTAACDRLSAAVPPNTLSPLYENAFKMADRFRMGAGILLRDSGHINGRTLEAVAVQFGQGVNFMDRVADYFER